MKVYYPIADKKQRINLLVLFFTPLKKGEVLLRNFKL